MSSTLRPYKFLVLPVLQVIDDDGNVTGEQQPQQPDAVFGVDGLQRYADGFDDALATHLVGTAARNGSAPVPERS